MSDEAGEGMELPENIRALAAECKPRHVAVVQAILSGDFPSNTKAYQSIYPDASDDAAKASVSRLLTTDNVAPLYRALRDVQLSERALTRAEGIDILSDMARTSIGDIATFSTREVGRDADTDTPIVQAVWSFRNADALTPAALRSISEVNATKDGLKIKMHDQKAAVRQLSDMLGWDEPKRIALEGGLTVTRPEMSLDEATRVYEANLKALRDGD